MIRLLAAVAWSGAAAACSAQVLPSHTVDVELEFSIKNSRSHWVAGYFPQFKRPIDRNRPSVSLTDKAGRTVIPETDLWFPDAARVEILDVTADTSANLYASVEVWSAGGYGTGAICKVAPGAKSIVVIKTDDFVTASIAVAKNGDIWAFGAPLLVSTTKRTSMEYDSLWHLDNSGKLLGKSIPRSDFAGEVIPTHAFGDLGGPHIWATSSHVGFSSATASRWIEVDPDSGKKTLDLVVERPKTQAGEYSILAEIAMTESDDGVYAFFVFRNANQSNPNTLYRLDKSSARWVPVYKNGPPQGFGGLFGAEGDSLVLRSGTKAFGWFLASQLSQGQ